MTLRALPPSGVPIRLSDIFSGMKAMMKADTAIQRFSQAVCTFFGVRHCFFASSGRAALSMLLTALHNIRPDKDEVILPAYTSFSVPSAVVNAGLKVSLSDVDAETMSFKIEDLEKSINDKTLCIVVCHLYGFPCDMDAIYDIAKKHGVYVIDDAAQAMGARYKGRYTGTLGYAGIFSLGRGKNLTTVDGGIVITNSEELAAEVSKVKLEKTGFIETFQIFVKALVISFLLRPRFYWIPQRLPFLNIGASIFDPAYSVRTFTGFQAGIGLTMLKRLKSINQDRKKIANIFMQRLEHVKNIHFPRVLSEADPAYLRLPLQCNDAVEPSPQLGIVKSYPYPLSEIEELKPFMTRQGRYTGAHMLSNNTLTLPTHNFVTERDVENIRTIIERLDTAHFEEPEPPPIV